MKSLRLLTLVALMLTLVPAAMAAEFGVRAGRLNDAEEEFVGVEALFDLGRFNLNPNIEYWLVDDVTAGTANLDLTFDLGGATVRPYLGAGAGLFYVSDDFFGDDTELLGNLIGGINFQLDFLKPYGQVKYSRSLENSDGDSDEIALTVGLRF